MNTQQLSGPLKVAVLLKCIGERAASQVLQGMNETERRVVQEHLTQLKTVSPDLVERITQEFRDLLSGKSKGPGGQKPPLPAAEAAAKAKEGEAPAVMPALSALKTIDPEQLFELIRNEHPQTITLIAAHLSPEAAGDLFGRLTEEVKVDVALRLASLNRINAAMVAEVDRVLSELVNGRRQHSVQRTGGVAQLAEILNNVDEATGQLILGEIEEADPDLAAEIKQRMFVFEDLVMVDDKGMQKVLRNVETGELAMALKGASEEVRQKILRNMSVRAGQMLLEDIESKGAVRLKDVEAAQQNITRIIQDFEAKGEIVIQGRRGGDLIA